MFARATLNDIEICAVPSDIVMAEPTVHRETATSSAEGSQSKYNVDSEGAEEVDISQVQISTVTSPTE